MPGKRYMQWRAGDAGYAGSADYPGMVVCAFSSLRSIRGRAAVESRASLVVCDQFGAPEVSIYRTEVSIGSCNLADH